MIYEKPKAEVIVFENSDVITASGIPGGGDDPIITDCIHGNSKKCNSQPGLNH